MHQVRHPASVPSIQRVRCTVQRSDGSALSMSQKIISRGRHVCRNEAYVGEVARADLTLRFFEFLDIQCPNNNIHNIRVCRALTAAGAVSTRHLSELNVPGKVCTQCWSIKIDDSCTQAWIRWLG